MEKIMASEKKTEVVIGGVYKTDLAENPIRVILYDNYQVFYEILWAHRKNWSNSSDLTGKAYYYRSSLGHFLNASVFLRVEQLSDEEVKVHRPDLPLAVCRNSLLSWFNNKTYMFNEYKKISAGHLNDLNSLDKLNIGKIVLVPFGAKGGYKKSVFVDAFNGNDFPGIELLWKANQVQSPHITASIEKGVGLYRLGFEKGVPSFYIGGYYDNAGFLKQI